MTKPSRTGVTPDEAEYTFRDALEAVGISEDDDSKKPAKKSNDASTVSTGVPNGEQANGVRPPG